jgi:hypothetical protein
MATMGCQEYQGGASFSLQHRLQPMSGRIGVG